MAQNEALLADLGLVGLDAVIGPDDPRYDDARRSFNGTVDRRPAAIVRPTDVEAVAAVVRIAADRGLPVAIRGGGHSVAGHGVADDALMVDLRRIRRVEVDPVARIARVGGGALWEDVDAAAFQHGLAVPGGTFADTGVGGLTLGGGLGWLLGVGGLTCDHLVAAEVVSGRGEILRAGPDDDPELLWALRGGGGNFGVVTALELSLEAVWPMYGGYLVYPVDVAEAVLARIEETASSGPDELELMPLLGTSEWVPDTTAVPGIAIGIAYAGPAGAAERAIRPLRGDWPVLVDDLLPRSYLEIQALNGTMEFGLRNYWTGHFTGNLGSAVRETVLAGFERRPAGTEAMILMESIHGQVHRIPDESAAFGQRAARWNVSPMTIWSDPADDAVHIGWARETAASLADHSLTGAGYVNYSPPDEPAERVRAAYGTARLERLVAVKRRMDPDNRFRFNHNIPPD